MVAILETPIHVAIRTMRQTPSLPGAGSRSHQLCVAARIPWPRRFLNFMLDFRIFYGMAPPMNWNNRCSASCLRAFV